jgi:hypothetical protein
MLLSIGLESLYGRSDSRILIKILIILFNLMAGVAESLEKGYDCARIIDFELFLWEEVARGFTLKGLDILKLELLSIVG